MKSFLTLIICLPSFLVYSQDTLDLPTKIEKEFVDSLSKVYNRKVVGYTKIGNTMTHIQFIKNSRTYELSLVGFRLETLCPQSPQRTTNRTVYPHGNR
jgi:hypothetical protein